MMDNINISNKLYDVNFWEYEPKRKLSKDDIPSSMLLYQSIIAENKINTDLKIATQIQKFSGLGKTIWGYKKDINGHGCWEYYFYLHKQNPKFEINSLINNLGHLFINFNPDTKNISEYFIVSFDVDPEMKSNINVYFSDLKQSKEKFYINNSTHYFDIENPHAYLIKYGEGNSVTKSNYYFGFYPWPITDGLIKEKIIQASIHLYKKEVPDFLNYVQLPFLKTNGDFTLKPISVAIKEKAIGLYFIDIGIDNLVIFLKYFKYPSLLINHILSNLEKYNYLKFDIGIDMVLQNEEVIISKGAFYGTL